MKAFKILLFFAFIAKADHLQKYEKSLLINAGYSNLIFLKTSKYILFNIASLFKFKNRTKVSNGVLIGLNFGIPMEVSYSLEFFDKLLRIAFLSFSNSLIYYILGFSFKHVELDLLFGNGLGMLLNFKITQNIFMGIMIQVPIIQLISLFEKNIEAAYGSFNPNIFLTFKINLD